MNLVDLPLEQLLPYVDSKYTLVSLAAKRARELLDGDPPLVVSRSNKPVTIALEEIANGLITYRREVVRMK